MAASGAVNLVLSVSTMDQYKYVNILTLIVEDKMTRNFDFQTLKVFNWIMVFDILCSPTTRG